MIVLRGLVQKVTYALLSRLSRFHAGSVPTTLGKERANRQTVCLVQLEAIAQSVELTTMENTGVPQVITAQKSE
jgi:hypothetical protein